jgi:hypothetical protein
MFLYVSQNVNKFLLFFHFFIIDLSYINNTRGFHCDNSIHACSVP